MYATPADLIARYGEPELIDLTDRGPVATGAVVPAVAQAAIHDACGEVDAYMGVRYSVPVTAPLPVQLVAVTCDIARYRLHDDRPTEDVRKRYEDAVRWLRDVSRGGAVLPSAAPAVGDAAGLAVVVQAGRKHFAGGL